MTGPGQIAAALSAWKASYAGGESVGLVDEPAFGSNPGGLRMRVHIPDGLSQGAPLVVALHGCTQTAEGYAVGAGWLTLAQRWGFAVLCPEQTRANNPNLCFNWFEPGDIVRGGGEAASIQAMITQTLRDHGLDARRVFITGLSAGAAMANVMLATYPEIFAGGALVSGLAYGSASNVHEAMAAMRNAHSRSAEAWGDAVRAASNSAGPWPSVSIWQGEEDTTVRPEVADELMRQWTNVHGLEATDGEASGSSNRRRRVVWRKPSGQVAVELHRIAGMGHGVPLGCTGDDGCGRPGPYLLEVGISSSVEIARSWGLLDGPRRDTADAAPVAASANWAPAPQTTSSSPVGEVGAIITSALRGAGLLR